MKSCIFILCFLNYQVILSQEIEGENFERLYSKEILIGINVNTNGWGINSEYNKQINYKIKKSYSLTLTNIRHSKEYKIIGTGGVRGYFFGKTISLVSLRLYYGGDYLLYKSKRESGVEISYKYRIGLNVGLIKPVYLEIDKITGNNIVQESEKYDPENHYPGIIHSRSKWYKGLNESFINIGFSGKTGFDFNFSNENSIVSGGEIGALIDYFPFGNINIMHNTKNYNTFLSLYLQLNIGNRY